MKIVTLKDGRTAWLRPPEKKDAGELLEYLRVTAGETEFLLRYPEEVTYTIEQEERIIESWAGNGNETHIVAEVEGEIAGVCALVFNTKLKMRHRAEVAVALKKKFWNLGIGSAMFEEMIAAAKKRPGVIQLELDFVEGNERARHLYEKMGFRIAAVFPDKIMLKDGTLLNEYHMIKKL